MDITMKNLLINAVKEYGMKQSILSVDELQKKWDRCTADGKCEIPEISDLRVRSAIMGLGTILKEDAVHHSYITTIKVDFDEALLVTLIEKDHVLLAACAHEGIFSQHIASKAISLVQKRIAELPPVK